MACKVVQVLINLLWFLEVEATDDVEPISIRASPIAADVTNLSMFMRGSPLSQALLGVIKLLCDDSVQEARDYTSASCHHFAMTFMALLC